MEEFMREKWARTTKKMLSIGKISEIRIVGYFGELYLNNPEEFEFRPGDKKLIKAIVAHLKQAMHGENSLDQFRKGTRACVNEPNILKDQNSMKPMNCIENVETVGRTHYFLDALNSAAKRNENRKPGGFRYDNNIKSFAQYLRLLSGPLAYATIQCNLECCLPSLPSVNRYINKSSCHIAEGILRVDELLIYLKERKLPLAVGLSEDATRIVGRMQYDAKTNQIIGFTLPLNKINGMPVPFAYPARNANEILKHFSVEHSTSTYLNVIMVQPLSNVPAFCLLVYGSDNKYTANDVMNRWNHIVKELSYRNIEVISISSDSEPRYNAAMRRLSKLGQKSEFPNTIWYASDAKCLPFFVQDPIHIATKLRNFILRTTWNLRSLPFGQGNFIQLKLLYYSIDHFTKDKHELTTSILNPADKQNFRSVEKMCSVKVTNLLKSSVKGSHATVVFLEIIRDVTDAFLNPNLMPLERIRKVWYCVFLIRMWKKYIMTHRSYTLKKNFLTANCYSCIELNAHSLIQIMVYLRSINRPELFLPHLFGSQQCESVFRQLRSLTSTFSTVANCTTKEALNRFSKLHILNEITHSTSYFKYPRLGSKKHSNNSFELPTIAKIVKEIEQCSTNAIETALQFDLITEDDAYDPELFSCSIKPYSPKPEARESPKLILTPRILKLSHVNGITLKNFASTKVCVDETSPLIELFFENNTKRIVVKKSSFVWLLRKDWRRMSSDRLLRVQHSSRATRKTKSKQITVASTNRAKPKQIRKSKRLLYSTNKKISN